MIYLLLGLLFPFSFPSFMFNFLCFSTKETGVTNGGKDNASYLDPECEFSSSHGKFFFLQFLQMFIFHNSVKFVYVDT